MRSLGALYSTIAAMVAQRSVFMLADPIGITTAVLLTGHYQSDSKTSSATAEHVILSRPGLSTYARCRHHCADKLNTFVAGFFGPIWPEI